MDWFGLACVYCGLAMVIATTAAQATQSLRPLVVDMVLYNGEPVGIYRMEYLMEVVDLFVIIESPITFTGKHKPIYMQQNEPVYNKLREQNKTLEIVEDSVGTDAWAREHYLRNIGLRKLNEFIGNRRYVLIVADVDEIPRKSYVAKFSDMYHEIGTGMRIVMINIMYNFKWGKAAKPGIYTYSPYVITDQGIRQHKASLNDMRILPGYMGGMTHIWYGGWHCSYCMNATDIIRKLESFSHQEFNLERYKSLSYVNDAIDNGKPLFEMFNGYPIVYPYSCVHGLPECSKCNMSSSKYAFLLINNENCSHTLEFDNTIFLEYRDFHTTKRIIRNSHAFDYISDVSISSKVHPLFQMTAIVANKPVPKNERLRNPRTSLEKDKPKFVLSLMAKARPGASHGRERAMGREKGRNKGRMNGKQ